MKAIYLCDDCNCQEIAELCIAEGFGMEAQSFYDPAYIENNPNAIELHCDAIEKIKQRSFHGPFADLCPGSMDRMVRDLARFRYDQAAEIAKSLEIDRMILHHGYVPRTSPSGTWVKRCMIFWQDFLRDQPETMRVHLENVLEYDPELISEVISAIDDLRISICLDIGHAHCNSRVAPGKWVERLGEQIGYVHMHDNHGEEDEHLGFGKGTIALSEICNALNEYAPEAIWALEVEISEMGSSIAWLKENGFV